MQYVTQIDDLLDLYGEPVPASLVKVSKHLTPLYSKWIKSSRFCILSTVCGEKTDNSPRGDKISVVKVSDNKTLLLPDWPGNNRLDSLRNIIVDGRASLMFMIPGITTVVRTNGTAKITTDVNIKKQFAIQDKYPATVIVFKIQEVYVQCSKAIIRSELWSSDVTIEAPSLSDILEEARK